MLKERPWVRRSSKSRAEGDWLSNVSSVQHVWLDRNSIYFLKHRHTLESFISAVSLPLRFSEMKVTSFVTAQTVYAKVDLMCPNVLIQRVQIWWLTGKKISVPYFNVINSFLIYLLQLFFRWIQTKHRVEEDIRVFYKNTKYCFGITGLSFPWIWIVFLPFS